MTDTLDIQCSLLGGYISNPDLFEDVKHLMRTTLFTHPITQKSYEIIGAYHSKNVKPTHQIILNQLSKSGLKEGSQAIVIKFDEWANLSPDHVKEYVEQLFQDRAGKHLSNVFKGVIGDFSGTNPLEAMIKAKDAITAIELAYNNVSKEKTINNIIDDTMAEIARDMKKDNHIMSSWGIEDLDNVTGGLYPGIFVIGGRPGMGKTAAIISVAVANISMGIPVVIFSLEMPATQLIKRIISRLYNINSYALKTGQISQEEFETISSTIKSKINDLLIIDDTPGVTHQYIDTKLRAVRKKFPLTKFMVTIIDYMQLMGSVPDEMKGRSDESIMSMRCNKLNSYWKIHNTAIIELSQLSRQVESRNPPRPKLSDLKDSGSLEANADVVVLQYRPEYYEQNPVDKEGNDMRNVIEFNVVKNRHGKIKPVYARVKLAYNQFDKYQKDDNGIKQGEGEF